MLPQQQRRLSPSTTPLSPSDPTQPDTERRVLAILAIAAAALETRTLSARHLIFPLFIAGCATLQADAKIKVLDLVSAFEASGIGKNTARTRALLKAVYEEQRRVYDAGGRMADVDWLAVAREKNMNVVNCGL